MGSVTIGGQESSEHTSDNASIGDSGRFVLVHQALSRRQRIITNRVLIAGRSFEPFDTVLEEDPLLVWPSGYSRWYARYDSLEMVSKSFKDGEVVKSLSADLYS